MISRLGLTATIFIFVMISYSVAINAAEMPAPAKDGASGEKTIPANTGSIAPVPWTPVLLKTCITPQPFTGGDGKIYLLYDLVLNNFDMASSSLLRLDLLSGDGKLLHSFAPAELSRDLVHLDQPNQSSIIPPGGTAVLLINLSFDKDADVPDIIRHRLSTHTVMFGGLKDNSLTYEGAPLVVDRRTPVVIGPPLAGGNWVCVGGYASHKGHRAALFAVGDRLQSAQCFAIDWIRLDESHRATVGDPSRNEDDVSYGQTVYAVADGTISGIKDGLPDQPPDHPQGADRFDYPEGNAIVQDIGNSLFVTYAHLKPGSLKVKEGQRVKKAQPIALVGNSGNSTGAHLHIHVMDGPHPIAANGMPFLFETFHVAGEVHDVEKTMAATPPTKPVAVEQSRCSGEHKSQLPQEGLVIVFPEPAPKTPPAPPKPRTSAH